MVFVGVEAEGQFAIGLLDVVLLSSTTHPQYLVVVLFAIVVANLFQHFLLLFVRHVATINIKHD